MTPPMAGEATRSIVPPIAARTLAASATHARALQVARTVKARRQDEMALEQRTGSAEFGDHRLIGHLIISHPKYFRPSHVSFEFRSCAGPWGKESYGYPKHDR